MNRQKIRYGALVMGAALGSYALLIGHAEQALRPLTAILSALYGLSFTYTPALGYVARDMNLVVTPGCMGATLFTAAFLMLALGFAPEAHRARRLLVYYAFSLALALAVGVARIAMSLPFVFYESAQLIHTLVSLLMYFGCLLSLYRFMQARTRRYQNGNEQMDANQ